MNVEKLGQKAIEAYVQKTRGTSEKPATSTAKETVKPGQDQVSISKAARELQEAQKAVESVPDIREDKVADIKKRINDGTYSISAESLADKLLPLLNRDE
jgi:negative regulator of flagellin synthesis FlgM